MFMRTERLFLRPAFPEDWREIYRGINDAGLVRMLAKAPWPYHPEHAQAFCNAKRDPLDIRMVVTLPGADGSPVIGNIGMDCSQEVPEVGYWIARGHRGKGYASEALQGILQIAASLGVNKVQAGHYIDNPASGAVLRKAGFVSTGEVQPTHSLGRGGEMVLARRYALSLNDKSGFGGMIHSAMGDNRKPA